ncbi:MAG: FAD-dependent oxidoreductase [Planctomycetota bacterium]
MSNLYRDQTHSATVIADRSAISESPRNTAVEAEVDVLVVGGGPAGIAAALAAAKNGAKTLILERHGMLGGVWTAGLLNPLFDHARKGYIVAELIQRLQSANAWISWKWSNCFDVEIMKRELERWCDELKVEYWYHCPVVDAIVENGRVRGAIVEGKWGRRAVLTKVVIDASGEGDFAARAGAEYHLGRASDGLCQPTTLMFEIDGLPHDWVEDTSQGLYDAMTETIARCKLPWKLPFERANYVPWIINLPQAGTASVQLTHAYRVDSLDTRAVSRATADCRRMVHEAMDILHRLPGFEHIRLRATAAALGIRESRRILGGYILDISDVQTGRHFDDGITFGAFGVDIHEPAPGSGIPSGHDVKMRPYEIPYRCLLPRGLDGLLTAGRCISGTHEAHASYRVTGTCMGMGQAAGVAAAWAAADGVMPAAISGPALRKRLVGLGCGVLG